MRLPWLALLVTILAKPLTVTAQLTPFVEDVSSILTLGSYPALSASWSDIDNDGDLDVLVVGLIPNLDEGIDLYYQNDGDGEFTRSLFQTNEDLGAITNLGVWADVDNDGDFDIVTSSLSDGSLFLREDGPGSGVFMHLPSAMDQFEEQREIDVADFNGDGFLDGVLVRRFGNRNVLIRSAGGFESPMFSGDVYAETLDSGTACWGDADIDGLPELYMTNSNGVNSYFVNQGGTLVSDPLAGNTVTGDNGTGCAWGDFDNDGDLDLVVTTASQQGMGDYLFRNDGDSFSEVPFEPRILNTRGIAWGDVDNDGDLDLVTSRYSDTDGHTLYLNDGSGNLTAIDFGETRMTNSLTLVDDDEDGDLDLFVINGAYDFARRNQLYRNTTEGTGNWLEVDLRLESGGNRTGVGAHVFIYATIDAQPQTLLRPVLARSGRAAQSGYRVHFGLGDAAEVDSLVVKWPQGVDVEETVLYSVAVNQIITVTGIIPTPLEDDFRGTLEVERPYPNPSYGQLSIELRVTSREQVFVEVFDVLGRRVSRFVENGVPGSELRFTWSGKDNDGRDVAAGIYLIRVRQGDQIKGMRVTLLR